MGTMSEYDVIVVGGGNAAFCAALAAQEQGARVVMLEAAPEDEAGGNSRFTAGAFRCVYDGVDDLTAIMPDLTPDEVRVEGPDDKALVYRGGETIEWRVVEN